MAGENVWVIDDEECLRDLFSRHLSRFGSFEVRAFETADEALESLAAGEHPDAILCDLIANGKGMDGDKFYEKAGPYLDGCNRYYITGTPHILEERNTDLSRIRKVIAKPFSIAELAKTIEQGFRERAANSGNSAEHSQQNPYSGS